MADHRYWRIEIFNSGSNGSIGLGEIQLRSSQGGSDLTGSGSSSASHEDGSNTADKAFDDNTSTFWSTPNQNYPAWISYDFGVGNAYDIVEIVLTIRDDSYGVNSAPYNVGLSYSDDGSSWTLEYLWMGLSGWTQGSSQTLNVNSSDFIEQNDGSSRRYWSVEFHSSGDGYGSCAEMEMRETSGGSDETGSGSATAFASEAGKPASNAFDDDTGTLWGSYSSPSNVHGARWIYYDFGSGITKHIQEITWISRNDGYANENPWGYIILCSSDLSTWYWEWVDIYAGAWAAWSTGETRTFTRPDVSTTISLDKLSSSFLAKDLAVTGVPKTVPLDALSIASDPKDLIVDLEDDVYTTDFSEYAPDSSPSDWTMRWNTDDVWATIRNDGDLGTNCFEVKIYEDADCANSWDDVGTPTDVEVLAKYRFAEAPSYSVKANTIVRGSGSVGSYTCYEAILSSSDTISLRKRTGGSASYLITSEAFTTAYDTWYWVRFRVVGATQKVRVWEDGDEEPGTWDIEETDSDVTGAGWVAYEGGSNTLNYAYIDCDYFSAATGGLEAQYPDDVTLTFDKLNVASSAKDLSVLTEMTVPMDTLTVSSAPKDLNVVVGAIPMGKLSVVSAAKDVSAYGVGEVTMAVFDKLTVVSAAKDLTVVPSETTISIDKLILSGSAEDVTVTSILGSVDATLPALECEAHTVTHLSVDRNLPAITCEARMGDRVSVDSKLPAFQVEARGSSRFADDLKLPAVECESHLSENITLSVDAKLPVLQLSETRMGSRLDSTLPDMRIEASLAMDIILGVDAMLPGMSCEASGYCPNLGSVDAKIPPMLIDASITMSNNFSVDQALPGLTCLSQMYCASLGAVDKTLPNLKAEAIMYQEAWLGVDASLPALIMAGKGYGTGDGTGGAHLSERSRFEDYTLRYSR